MLYVSLQYRFDLSSREVALFQAWSMQDPPDQYEINRTWDIEARQGNANPFVVCPDLALFEPPYVRD